MLSLPPHGTVHFSCIYSAVFISFVQFIKSSSRTSTWAAVATWSCLETLQQLYLKSRRTTTTYTVPGNFNTLFNSVVPLALWWKSVASNLCLYLLSNLTVSLMAGKMTVLQMTHHQALEVELFVMVHGKNLNRLYFN